MRRLALLLAVIVSTVAVAVAGLAWAGSAFAAPARPDLVVDVTVSPVEVPAAGGDVQVAIVVRNVGSGAANDVKVKVRPPAGSSLAGDASSSWQCDYGTWKCAYGTLAAGDEAEVLTVPLRLPPASLGDVVTVSATVSTSSLEHATDNNTDKAKIAYTAVADLAVELTGDGTDVSNLGGREYAVVRVTNVGTVSVSDVRVTMDPPAGAWVQLENFTPDDWQCDVSGAPWVCNHAQLAPGLSSVIDIPVMFPGGTTGDTLTMTATASTTTPEKSLANNSAEVTFRYITPTPADVTITGMDAYPQQLVADDQVNLYIAVDNIGGSPADNVTVRLPLPDTVQPVSADGGHDQLPGAGLHQRPGLAGPGPRRAARRRRAGGPERLGRGPAAAVPQGGHDRSRLGYAQRLRRRRRHLHPAARARSVLRPGPGQPNAGLHDSQRRRRGDRLRRRPHGSRLRRCDRRKRGGQRDRRPAHRHRHRIGPRPVLTASASPADRRSPRSSQASASTPRRAGRPSPRGNSREVRK